MAAGFPVGSDQGDTKALAAIWTDKAGFDAAVANFNTAAGALRVASNAKNLDGIKAAFGEVGKTCGACHDKYRGK
jgi:cytochrome c556